MAAEATGLLAGTPVYGGLFDVVASAVCSGVSDDKTLSAVAGTWSIATCVTDRVMAAEHHYVWGSYCIPGKYFVHEGSPTSAANLSWFMRTFWGNDASLYPKFDQWVNNKRGQQSEVVFLPYLFGSNLSLNLNGSLIGMRSHHGMPDVVNAIYQGIVFSHLLHQDRVLQLNPNVERIRITGGPTHSLAWMQMFADAGNLPLEVVDIQQCGCRAAALCAAVGAGYYANFSEAMAATQPAVRTFVPQQASHQNLRQQMTRYLHVAEALSEVEYAE
ncbi:FGGY-family carbohydrate kinase [Serratia sp. L9]|uniref:FGGY-family carbohydrate kinase n=1 Tax=Serratia sp. L9 TaxID=3423946 RepID=UPI003D671550